MINIDYIVGDSIAAGIAIGPFKLSTRSGSVGIKSTDAKGISKVGARPIEILGYLNEIGKEKFRGKNVIISTGLSNGSKDVANIEKQLQLLKDVDAKVYMIGVSNNPPDSLKVELVNSKLENLATKFGFTFFGGFAPSADKVHPTSYTSYYNTAIKPVLSKVEDPAPVATPVSPPAAAQSKSVIATGPGKDFINKYNEELEKVYKDAITSLGPWKKAREEAIKITKPRIGTWPVDPAVKTIGDLFAYVFFDPDGLKFNSPPWFQIKEDGNTRNDEVLQKQYNDWINDMNGGMPLPTSPTAPLVLDPTISAIFKSLAWPYTSSWTGKLRNSNLPIVLPKSTVIIENYNEIKKPGITNPDKYSAGQWWFDMFMSEVIGLNGLYGYLKSKSDGSTNERIEEAFEKSRYSYKFLDNNKKTEGDTNLYTISVSKFVKGETVPYLPSTASGVFDRQNYTDYGSGDQESSSGKKYPGYGFAKILELIERRRRGEFNFSTPPNIEYGGFDLFDSLKTQYRPGVNSLESLSKDPLFNPMRTSIDDIDWTAVGITQSQETGIYWESMRLGAVGSTASVVGNFENILLYNAFLEAGDDYKTITIPKYAPSPDVEPVISTLVPTTESKLSGEFTFNVEKEKTFVVVGNQNFALKIGDLVIEGLTTSSVIDSPKTIDLGDGIIIIDDEESDEDIYSEDSFKGTEEELALTMERIDYQQSQLPPDTPASTVDVKEENINYNDPSFKGEAWKNFDISVAVNKINKTKFGPNSIFLESLKKVLFLIKNDAEIKDLREAAYMLGTAFGESGYSLQRWEADYACNSTGIKYGPAGPCAKATNYYKSTDGKKNYYTLGTDKNGVCFFGRGLIQLTGKDNYEKYGKKIGVDLLNNGDLAMDPINSYKIASVYMRGRTFIYVTNPSAKFTTKHGSWTGLEAARRSVNGGTKEMDKINNAYNAWVTVLKESKAGAV